MKKNIDFNMNSDNVDNAENPSDLMNKNIYLNNSSNNVDNVENPSDLMDKNIDLNNISNNVDNVENHSDLLDKNMDFNIELDNIKHLEDQPLKRSKCSKLMDFEIEKGVDSNFAPPPLPSVQTDLGIVMDCNDQSSEEEKSEEKDHMIDQTYDELPQDLTMTDKDFCAHITIESSCATDILVKIDDIFVNQNQLACLLDQGKYLNDDVISAYICCLKQQAHLQVRNGLKVYFENPIYSGLLKRDGIITVDKDGSFITRIVRNYLSHDLILLPINVKDTHWYLAVLNVKMCEIQVIDSLCWKFNRVDLSTTLQGLQSHINILLKKEDMLVQKWNNLNVTKWTIKEQLEEPIQKDSSSCGLFMLKFMEYWTGDELSQDITQDNINHFRSKLAGILLCWKSNTAGLIPNDGESHHIEDSSNDIIMFEKSDIEKDSKPIGLITSETRYRSLMSVLSKISGHELISCLCDYIRTINCAKTLNKIWLQSSKPFSISLNLKKLQHILKENEPMDNDCFNLIIRKNMSDYMQHMKKLKGPISKHYLDLRFWTNIDFGRHPNFRKKLDVDQLKESICKWPGAEYTVARCKSILIPINELSGAFILFILNQEARTVYILDPNPLNPIYKYNPNAKYVKKLLCISEYLKKSMANPIPGSRWNEDIFLWRQIILTDIPIYNRELSGYVVSMCMSAWKDEKLHLPQIKGGYELRKHFLGQLLTMKENNCEDNLPPGVQDFIRCIKKSQKESDLEIVKCLLHIYILYKTVLNMNQFDMNKGFA